MPKTVAIIQARMTSTRLPGKIMLPLAGKPLLERMIERVQQMKDVDVICIACPDGKESQPIRELVHNMDDVELVEGSESDVLSRYVKTARQFKADIIIRFTSDCPFMDPEISNAKLELYKSMDGIEYVSKDFKTGYPLGLHAEIMSRNALEAAYNSNPDGYEREHVTPYIWRRPEQFPAIHLDYKPNLRDWRLVVDTKEDYQFAKQLFEVLYTKNHRFRFKDIKSHIEANPDMLKINTHIEQKPFEWKETTHG
jgi:spore coat polysaccharide biosynthesis protein SpsF